MRLRSGARSPSRGAVRIPVRRAPDGAAPAASLSPVSGEHRNAAEPPTWWPEGEAWPPKRADGKARFLRKVGCFFGGGMAIIVAASLLGAIFGRGGPATVAVLLALILTVAVMGRTLRRAAVPLAEVIAAADRVATGDYAARVPVRPGNRGDIGRLVRTFNAMASQLESDETQRRALFADVAHELRTPLSVIRGSVEGMLDGIYPRDDERLQTLLEETEIVNRLLDDLRTLSLADAGQLSLHPEPTDLAGLLDDLVTGFEPRAAAAGVRLAASAPAMPMLALDPVRIRQTLDNLVANALRHTPRGGEVAIVVQPIPGAVRFTVRDTGAGIPHEHLPHVFERFWKSADSGGSGLGLAICRGIVEAHGGTIGAESAPGHGTTIWFTIPAGSPPRA